MIETAHLSLSARAALLGARTQIQFRRFVHSFKYISDQPRDEQGRWAEGDASVDDNAVVRTAARRNAQREKEYDEQLKRDIFQCNMVGLRSCYAQAHERYAACLVGRPLPPFNY